MIVSVVTGIGRSEPSVTASVKAFLLAWQSGDYAAAAALTTGRPVVVARTLKDAYSQLGAEDLALGMGRIRVHGDTAHAYFHASVDLGRGGRPWDYPGSFTLRRVGSHWLVVWSPSVVVPGLGVGDRLAVLTSVPARAPLLDAAGKPLILRSPVVEVGVRPGRVTEPLATARKLAKVTGLAQSEADQMVGQILAAPPNYFLELVQLSPRKFRHLSPALGKVPHLTHRWVTRRLFRSVVPEISGQVGTEAARELVEAGAPYRPGTTVGLSGLEQAYQATLAGTPTTKVVVQNAKGHQVTVLKQWPGQRGKPVRTTIDGRIQQAARSALAGLGYSAAVVAVGANSGKILAVAEHQADGMPPVDPLRGRYQPGQAFTIVPTAALLSTEANFGASSQVPCYPTQKVGGQVYANIPAEPRLGKPMFGADFAHACSTAFAALSLRLSSAELYSAAGSFGIGAQWRLPLQPEPYPGSMQEPGADDLRERSADAIGTGTVLVSPLDMALAAGVVDSGSWHQPSVVTNPSGPTLTSGAKTPVKFKSHVISQLQQLMAQTVSSGAARAAHLPGTTLYGQVGTAPLAGHPRLQAIWFVGFRGDVAFAVIAFSQVMTFDPAVMVARQFAERLPAGGSSGRS